MEDDLIIFDVMLIFERNRSCFENKECFMGKLKEFFFSTLRKALVLNGNNLHGLLLALSSS